MGISACLGGGKGAHGPRSACHLDEIFPIEATEWFGDVQRDRRVIPAGPSSFEPLA